MSELQPSEVLCIPKRKRLTHGRFKNEDGQEVLHLFYGEVERFRGDEAMAWSNAAPHDWEKIRDLLQAQVNLLQTTLDHQSALVLFEAVQQAPPPGSNDVIAIRGADIVLVPTPTPRGLFRTGPGQ